MPKPTERVSNGEERGNLTPSLSSGSTALSATEKALWAEGFRGDRPQPASRPNWRWWLAVLVGVALSVPLGWLLSYGGALLFMLGLFFFVLFGLFLGAMVYRLAESGRPYSGGSILLGTAMIVLVCWSIAVYKEVAEVPHDLARDVLRSTRTLGDRSATEFREAIIERIKAYLSDRYPPGGVLGTVRWIVTSGQIAAGEIAEVKRPIQRRGDQRGAWWTIRVVLSLTALGFGLGSQTWSLASRGLLARADVLGDKVTEA